FGGRGNAFFYLLPFIEQDNVYKLSLATPYTPPPSTTAQPNGIANQAPPNSVIQTVIPPFLSPSDFSQSTGQGLNNCGVSNYAANFMVFGKAIDPLGNTAGPSGAATGIQDGALNVAKVSNADGSSNTIFFVTKYGVCTGGTAGGSLWSSFLGVAFPCNANSTTNANYLPFFYYSSKLPPQIQPVLSTPPPPGSQVCVPALAHAYSPGGSQCAMGDGSVRDIAPSISQITWTDVCTPMGGEVVPSDWNN